MSFHSHGLVPLERPAQYLTWLCPPGVGEPGEWNVSLAGVGDGGLRSNLDVSAGFDEEAGFTMGASDSPKVAGEWPFFLNSSIFSFSPNTFHLSHARRFLCLRFEGILYPPLSTAPADGHGAALYCNYLLTGLSSGRTVRSSRARVCLGHQVSVPEALCLAHTVNWQSVPAHCLLLFL